MQAILLATGESKKLRPLTKTIPSPMLPVANRPVMAYAKELLIRQGFKHIFVNMHHLPGSIESYFGNGERWGIELEYMLQRDAWGSAGALKWDEQALNETILLLPGDALIELDIAAALQQHQERGSQLTAVLHPCADGIQMHTDASGWVTDTKTKGSHPDGLYATGAYLIEPALLQQIPAHTHFEIEKDLLPRLLDAGTLVYGYPMSGYCNSLSDLKSYQEAQEQYLNSAAKKGQRSQLSHANVAGRQFGEGIWVGKNSFIHPSAQIAAPICIGQNCQIGADVELGPGTIIGKNVIIGSGASIQHSTILDNSYVGRLVNIENRIINKRLMIDFMSEESTLIEDNFLLGEVDEVVLEDTFLRALGILLTLLFLLFTFPATVLVAIITLITNGRVFTPTVCVNPLLSQKGGDAPSEFSLWRFAVNGRSTGWNQFLKKSYIYRLPELWNVIKGDMVLVGVKPLTLAETALVTEPWQQKRNEYRAGFTGLWFVQVSAESSLDEILINDAYYVATRSFSEDIKLLWRTGTIWFAKLTRKPPTNPEQATLASSELTAN